MNILEQIYQDKLIEVRNKKKQISGQELCRQIKCGNVAPRNFIATIEQKISQNKIAIIAEVKKMTWFTIIIAGILTYFTRMTMIALIDRDMLGDKIKAVLEYVPSAVFPAIIFPAIFINDYGAFIEMNDPKIFGAIVAIIVGYFSKNIIATIISGLISYWFLIFIVFS